MPEGHTIHGLARGIGRDLTGEVVRASSPQGRFADGAARLDGEKLERADAYGKHLFCTWSTGEVLHVHLGLIGVFRRQPSPPDEPVGQIRLRLEGPTATWDLSGPNLCTLITPEQKDAVVARLGPDPLRRNRGPEPFQERLARRTVPIGAALLDQSVVAGIGNVYRAELLYLLATHPSLPARDLPPAESAQLWDLAVSQLRLGLRLGRIVTVDPADVGRRIAGRIPSDERLYVYKRGGLPCRRCDSEIEMLDVGGRRTWLCPTEQKR